MEASHKTHRPHIKVGKDEEKKKERRIKRYASNSKETYFFFGNSDTTNTPSSPKNMRTPHDAFRVDGYTVNPHSEYTGCCKKKPHNVLLHRVFKEPGNVLLCTSSFQRTHEMCQNNPCKCKFYPWTVFPQCRNNPTEVLKLHF